MIQANALIAQGAADYPAFTPQEGPIGGVRYSPILLRQNLHESAYLNQTEAESFLGKFNDQVDGVITLGITNPILTNSDLTLPQVSFEPPPILAGFINQKETNPTTRQASMQGKELLQDMGFPFLFIIAAFLIARNVN